MAENPVADPEQGGEEQAVDLSNPAVQAVIQQAVQNATKPLAQNNQKLLDQLKRKGELVESLGGEDGIEEYKAFREQAEADEAKKKLLKGDEAGYRESLLKPLRDQWQKREAELTTKLEEANTAREQERRTRIQNRIKNDTMLAAASKVEDGALELLVQQALGTFEIDEELGDDPVILNDGVPVIGSDGRSAKTIAEWINDMQEAKPFLFKKSSGIGATGSAGQRYSADQIAGMSPAEKLKLARRGGGLKKS